MAQLLVDPVAQAHEIKTKFGYVESRADQQWQTHGDQLRAAVGNGESMRWFLQAN